MFSPYTSEYAVFTPKTKNMSEVWPLPELGKCGFSHLQALRFGLASYYYLVIDEDTPSIACCQ